MERPRKRPRLQHVIGSATPEPDDELAIAREKNDKLLKSRWEAIFRKYEHDFDGIGDEIGVQSGQIEVDNGHIRSMQDERDTGKTFRAMSVFDGRRMLRAMTVASSDSETSLPEADDVLQSIETIAGNAQLLEISSEDDLFEADQEDADNDEDELSAGYYTTPAPRVKREATVTTRLTGSRNGSRDSSVDSLFATRTTPKLARDTSSAALEYAELESPASNLHQSISTPMIRQKVRQMIEEEKLHERAQAEQKVDAAWRIPVRIPSPRFYVPQVMRTSALSQDRSMSVSTRGSDQDDPETALPTDLGLWGKRPRKRRRTENLDAIATVQQITSPAKEQSLRRIRDQSEDPLQEGFSDDLGDNRTNGTIDGDDFEEIGSTSGVMREPKARSQSRHVSSQGPDLGELDELSSPVRSKTRTTCRRRRVPSLRFDDEDESDVYQPGSSDVEQARLDEAEDEGAESSEDELSEGMTPEPPATKSVEPEPKQKAPKMRIRASQIVPVGHPWDAPTTRTGGPINDLALSIRRTASCKFAKAFISVGAEDDTDDVLTQIPALEPNPELLALRNKRGDEVMKVMDRAQCFYCKLYYTAKHAVGSHWDRILTNETMGSLSKDDPHNLEFLREVRSSVARKNRAPTTLLLDFVKLIELHEGSKLSFEEISDLKCLICRKSGKQLKMEYELYRQPDAPSAIFWSEDCEERLEHLLDIADNKLTMFQTHKLLGAIPMMTFVDIGNKMAEKVLDKYKADPAGIMEQIREARKAKAERDAGRIRSDSRDARSESRSESQQPAALAGPRTWNPNVTNLQYFAPVPGQHVSYIAPDGHYPHTVWDEERQGFWVANPAPPPVPQTPRYGSMAPEPSLHGTPYPQIYGTMPQPYMFDQRMMPDGYVLYQEAGRRTPFPMQGIAPLLHGMTPAPLSGPRQGIMPLEPVPDQ